MIAVGMGFLILAPVLLFSRHVTLLAQDWRNTALPWFHKLALALIAVAVIPVSILTNAYLDRAAFRALLDYAFSPDITQDTTLPVSPARARRVLERADAFKHSNETPILSAVYTQIVFDGLVLPDDRFNFMWDCYVGGERPDGSSDTWRNVFGNLFSRNQARRERRASVRLASLPGGSPALPAIESGEVTVAVSTNNYEQTVTLRLRITSPDSQQQEFRAPVTLPSATWVTGMRLKIDGEWQDASIIERRAAEWVYKQITTQRRDPAILTLDTPERGLLRVFPVSSALPRELEITFLQPAGMQKKITIGENVFKVTSEAILQQPICAADTVFNQTQHSVSVSHQNPTLIVIDSSVNGVSPENVNECLEKYRGISHCVLSVNAETKKTDIGPTDAIPPTGVILLPNRFGLDVVRAVRDVEYGIRAHNNNQSDEPWHPSDVIFIGDKWEKLLPTVSPKDYGLLRDCLIFTSDGQKINYTFNNDGLIVERWYPENCTGYAEIRTPTYPDHLLWTQGATLWKFQQDCYDHGTLNANFKKILADSSRTGILVPQTAYIVVETDAQRKMLQVKQAEAANAHHALDFDYVTTDAPPLLILALAFALIKLLPKLLRPTDNRTT